jgi:hypothetical protein
MDLFRCTIQDNKKGQIKQINAECKYLHLEKLTDDHWWLGVVLVDNSNIDFNFLLDKNGAIQCNAEFDKTKLQSFPFAEEKK